MIRRRAVLGGVAALAAAGGAWMAGAYRASMAAAETRLAQRSRVIDTTAGALEFAVAGQGQPLMIIHGAGGGFDQGLLFAHRLPDSGFQIIAPSRFGYLRSDLPDDTSPAHQADVLVELLDHLGIDRIPVAGGSAGTLTAAEFGLRHPDRCSHLVLLVPAANLTGRDPVEFTALQKTAVDLVIKSDFAFWVLSRLAPEQMIRTLMATDPALLDHVSRDEKRRAELIFEGLPPIRRKTGGVRADAYWASTLSATAYERIAVPTLILSCEDDLFGTAATARLLAERIPEARLTIWPQGGHIWLGHDADMAQQISSFLQPDARQVIGSRTSTGR